MPSSNAKQLPFTRRQRGWDQMRWDECCAVCCEVASVPDISVLSHFGPWTSWLVCRIRYYDVSGGNALFPNYFGEDLLCSLNYNFNVLNVRVLREKQRVLCFLIFASNVRNSYESCDITTDDHVSRPEYAIVQCVLEISWAYPGIFK